MANVWLHIRERFTFNKDEWVASLLGFAAMVASIGAFICLLYVITILVRLISLGG